MEINEVIYFSHELDMLEAHMEEHQNFVDKFFIKESPVWWSGVKKPLIFSENRKRFERFNYELIIIPPEEFNLNIPKQFPKEEFKKWFDVRRSNRHKSRCYQWDKISKGADYVMSMDTDEIIDSRRFHLLLEKMENKENEFICITLKQCQFWVNVPGKKVELYRVFRGDQPYTGNVKGRKRCKTPTIGWHFTNCFVNGNDIRNKAIGISTHYGYNGVDEIPNAKVLKEVVNRFQNPFRTRWSKGQLVESELNITPKRSWDYKNKDWAPKFMRENPHKFPWYKN